MNTEAGADREMEKHVPEKDKLSSQHILVCGGIGYIGVRMAPRLLREGFRVTVFDAGES